MVNCSTVTLVKTRGFEWGRFENNEKGKKYENLVAPHGE